MSLVLQAILPFLKGRFNPFPTLTLGPECKGCPVTLCKGCHGTGQLKRRSSAVLFQIPEPSVVLPNSEFFPQGAIACVRGEMGRVCLGVGAAGEDARRTAGGTPALRLLALRWRTLPRRRWGLWGVRSRWLWGGLRPGAGCG